MKSEMKTNKEGAMKRGNRKWVLAVIIVAIWGIMCLPADLMAAPQGVLKEAGFG